MTFRSCRNVSEPCGGFAIIYEPGFLFFFYVFAYILIILAVAQAARVAVFSLACTSLHFKCTYFQGLNLNVSSLRQVLLGGLAATLWEMHDVMFECACDQRRFAVKRFNVGLRKRLNG